jgi:regulator of cell morphogenesis and NO signaling
MSISKEETVAEIVTKNPITSKVFYKYGIDFCCGGKIPLTESCQKHNVELKEVLEDLNIASSTNIEEDIKPGYSSAKELIDEIIEDYHEPLYELLPIVHQLSAKVARVHGDSHPELKALHSLCIKMEAELVEHMHKEEKILFPMIISLEDKNDLSAACHTVQGPINQMEHEHDDVKEVIQEIKRITNNLKAPEDACNSYRGLFAMLKELEFELYKHIHLENNILHPMAAKLEASN